MMLPLLGLLDILETTVKYVNKALLPLLVLAFGLGAVAQVMILFTRRPRHCRPRLHCRYWNHLRRCRHGSGEAGRARQASGRVATDAPLDR